VIERSRLLERHPEIDLAQNRVGIYARFVSLEALVQNGDRVEVYRPLQADPKELRRQRTRA
jgi:putative ubiquitin-RnfH superfamily antitoxin RatB of RatAB toxin-antitoxin module